MPVVEKPEATDVPAPEGDYNLILPFTFLNHQETACGALLILNQDLSGSGVLKLWQRTQLHVCADGGANRLYSFWKSDDDRKKYIPDFIVGDLDLLLVEVRDYYKSHGSRIIPQYSQYATDLTKSLYLIRVWYRNAKLLESDIEEHEGLLKLSDEINETDKLTSNNVYIIGGMGGRFDQSAHLINQLFKITMMLNRELDLFMITTTDVIFSTQKGTNYITYENKLLFYPSKKVPICGILPLGCPTVLNTNGLIYDVIDWPSSMYGDASSSNGVSGTKGFIVDTTEPVIINIEFDILLIQ